MALSAIEAKQEFLDSPKAVLNVQGCKAVVVSTEYAPGKSNFGVQFWNTALIEVGTAKNTDGSASRLVEVISQ